MAKLSLQSSVFKLTMAGEQAGFTIDQMIQMLNAGVTVEGLLRVIAFRLTPFTDTSRCSRWIM
jgi:hypothetical protein